MRIQIEIRIQVDIRIRINTLITPGPGCHKQQRRCGHNDNITSRPSLMRMRQPGPLPAPPPMWASRGANQPINKLMRVVRLGSGRNQKPLKP